MHRAVHPLMIVGLAQWAALAWWRRVDGIPVHASFRLVCIELFGAEPRVAWDPAERLLSAGLDLNPGTVCLVLAGYLIVRTALGRWASERGRRLLLTEAARLIKRSVLRVLSIPASGTPRKPLPARGEAGAAPGSGT